MVCKNKKDLSEYYSMIIILMSSEESRESQYDICSSVLELLFNELMHELKENPKFNVGLILDKFASIKLKFKQLKKIQFSRQLQLIQPELILVKDVKKIEDNKVISKSLELILYELKIMTQINTISETIDRAKDKIEILDVNLSKSFIEDIRDNVKLNLITIKINHNISEELIFYINPDEDVEIWVENYRKVNKNTNSLVILSEYCKVKCEGIKGNMEHCDEFSIKCPNTIKITILPIIISNILRVKQIN